MILVSAFIAACTRSEVPVDFETSQFPTQIDPTVVLEVTRAIEDPNPDDLAVVWVPEGENLILRSSAGIAAEVVAEIAFDQTGIVATGVATSLGSSTWAEIETSIGEIGWAPTWNLTEEIPDALFCEDNAVDQLLVVLGHSLANADANLLQALLSPRRGMIIRYDLSNPEVSIPSDRLSQLFNDRRSYQWGTRFASQTVIEGSFREVILPSIQEVFQEDSMRSCNEILVGENAPDLDWPGEYKNLNFISLYHAAEDDSNPFDWRTWIVVIEYIEGEPYLALLIQIRPQV